MDFQKASDTVPHKRMISKLKSYGIEDPILSWIENYLSDRKQKVIINGKSSEWKDVTSGIPQGSVLEPLLFVIFINDLPDCVDSDAYLFADDTKIYKIIKEDNDRETLQHDLKKMTEWSDK
jgi:hypothetical protein